MIRHKKLAPSVRIQLIEFNLMTGLKGIKMKCGRIWGRFLFVCLGFFILLKHFHSYGDFIIAVEGLQILNYVQHSWPLSGKGS